MAPVGSLDLFGSFGGLAVDTHPLEFVYAQSTSAANFYVQD